MKLGIIMPPKPESFEQAKELGLDFVEFDCNPADFFGAPMAELTARQEELKAASQRTGIEVGAVGQPYPGRKRPGKARRMGRGLGRD